MQRDSFYERETALQMTIPSRELILSEMESMGKPVTLSQLTKLLLEAEEAIEGLSAPDGNDSRWSGHGQST